MGVGVLFDYNGVLVADEHLQQQAMGDVVAKYGVELSDRAYSDLCLGRTDKEGFENIRNAFSQLADVSIDQLIAQKVARYQDIVREGSIITPGVQDIVARLSKEFILGVVTGAFRLEVEPVLEQSNMKKYFRCVITADNISRGKPNPEGYLKGVEALGLQKESVVVIEDTPTGIRAAKAAGLVCVAVEHTVERNQLGEADRIVASVRDITPEIIRDMLAL